MERVAFLLEPGPERIGCMLNPEGLSMRRLAGVRPRQSPGGAIAGAGLSDDPLLFTGGGTTELDLDLLFDVTIAGSSTQTDDVRDLTAPLWHLTENAVQDGTYARPPNVRFVWGKAWNILGVVISVAERFESFTAGGSPRRPWLRMCMRRVPEPPPYHPVSAGPLEVPELPDVLEPLPETPPDLARVHEMLAGGPDDATGSQTSGERLDEIAYRYFNDARAWRSLAYFNDIADPLRVPANLPLNLPRAFGPGAAP